MIDKRSYRLSFVGAALSIVACVFHLLEIKIGLGVLYAVASFYLVQDGYRLRRRYYTERDELIKAISERIKGESSE